MTTVGDGYLFEKLSVLNDAYNNSLVPNKNVSSQHLAIKTNLFPHQLLLLDGMHKYREKMTNGFLHDNHAINGKIGIISDPPGTGKTLTILAYIASNTVANKTTRELTNNSSRYFFSHEIVTSTDASSSNLIIVPHYLFHQWRSEIEQHTTMSYVPIETKRIIRGTDLAQNIINSQFVLTTNKCYKFLQDYAADNNIQWNNVFIDEASSIYINSSDPHIRFQFLWLVTNNWIPLLFKNPSLSKANLLYLKDRLKMHCDLEQWLEEINGTHYEGILNSSAFLKEYLLIHN